ncbi:Glu-tRNAGln amidotransferase, C subunit [Candidatus Desulfofervidus auxilii]|uniref:Aspartyl/glutamyl-tRNA(Asn/Gln) amidotransferase subunit C n=1 Tax=Desulfofervidus auxilii TaxID=1621989 RepID=A0A7C1VTP3_DESA2|nr:Asp-tRNA(Asn)/Glu-tRNA(Gln) amidotransferase subunit GatC [Candidatus Desulfofervidus auxilii]CAD7777584.1 MAG: Aspartyl/glutamyl-tRNA(Asn/Gln) amidotransferasesubunit C [Candidatus Methanoperedenaceae archaeon GB37]CAD7778693.1 MAG: Aspartyl/glutamyl-tRNA(Asn/Gln) amidotransferasesubunit C [Candidatus Methanoperedenaceae archaeon GB50]AMM42279.1 Glu-tRNAGln amidotransferase, C subunit [Candidatus Desulfofervidus auxilii]CAD7782425.1 Aspartyl/glutamyl-tRNA(Asn/Gln) amidotransferasesubunit C 
MKITKKEVAHIAELARLSFSGKEMELFTEQLNQILVYMEKLNEIDTSEIKPTYHALDLINVFRDDQIEPSLSTQKVLFNAPQSDKDMVTVPRII